MIKKRAIFLLQFLAIGVFLASIIFSFPQITHLVGFEPLAYKRVIAPLGILAYFFYRAYYKLSHKYHGLTDAPFSFIHVIPIFGWIMLSVILVFTYFQTIYFKSISFPEIQEKTFEVNNYQENLSIDKDGFARSKIFFTSFKNWRKKQDPLFTKIMNFNKPGTLSDIIPNELTLSQIAAENKNYIETIERNHWLEYHSFMKSVSKLTFQNTHASWSLERLEPLSNRIPFKHFMEETFSLWSIKCAQKRYNPCLDYFNIPYTRGDIYLNSYGNFKTVSYGAIMREMWLEGFEYALKKDMTLEVLQNLKKHLSWSLDYHTIREQMVKQEYHRAYTTLQYKIAKAKISETLEELPYSPRFFDQQETEKILQHMYKTILEKGENKRLYYLQDEFNWFDTSRDKFIKNYIPQIYPKHRKNFIWRTVLLKTLITPLEIKFRLKSLEEKRSNLYNEVIERIKTKK